MFCLTGAVGLVSVVVILFVGLGPGDSDLVRAAREVHFHSTIDGTVGTVEDLPPLSANPQPVALEGLLAPGTPAPRFSLVTPSGQRVSLEDCRGKAVLVDFSATWCPHCQAEVGHLEKIFHSLTAGRTALVAVNTDSEDPASLLAFSLYFGTDFPFLLDPGPQPGSFHHRGGPGPVTLAYGVRHLPTFYIIDPWGRVFWRSVGERSDAEVRERWLGALSVEPATGLECNTGPGFPRP